ncbi:unnamed protein product [Ambrosiozyma monospora]|uniref:Unnamed protein product n=1 Tax=Ambrosiozyma monospora TaxID=43982 RepID=A0ACB5TCZ0_AMBMO|nr:unnamed protein product [Ambrosiozyma monospora]
MVSRPLQQLRSKLETELLVYKRLWEHNRHFQLTNPAWCMNAPQLIHYGEIIEDQKKSSKINFTESQVNEANYPGGLCHVAGPFIILEYLQNVKHPDQEEELRKVKSMISNLHDIAVRYPKGETPDGTCLYDSTNKKPYIIDFENCIVDPSSRYDACLALDLSEQFKKMNHIASVPVV